MALAFATLVLIGVGTVSVYSLLTVILDGGAALLVLGPLCLGGWALLPAIRANRLPIRWQALLAAVFGLGIGSNLVLVLGLFSCLSRQLWLGLLTLAAVAGLARIWSQRRAATVRQLTTAAPVTSGNWRYLLFLLVPFAVIALLAASAAPGTFWSEEGYGYDVLEYHLELPKEYYLAGRISYAPHNVYASFPANVEMLYLLSMIVLDDVRDVGAVAQLIHLLIGLFTVYAAWVIASDWSPCAGIIAAVILGTCGWLVYLSALAYNDNGVLFFGMVAIGALIRAWSANAHLAIFKSGRIPWNSFGFSLELWLVICGLSAGFACGCKYTAVAFIALPVIAVAPFIDRAAWAQRVKWMALMAAGVGIAFSPWLVKNAVFTRNPVFPLANTIFQANPPGFGPEQTIQWKTGHEPTPSEQGVLARVNTAWQRVILDPDQRFGALILILAILGFRRQRTNSDNRILILILAMQLCVWLFATHLFARFATPMLLPLTLLCAQIADASNSRWQTSTISILLAGAAYNFERTERLYVRERGGINAAPASIFYDGDLPGLEYLGFINHELPANAHVLMVGDSKAFYMQRRVDYCVVFNESPLARFVREHNSPIDIIQWLKTRGYTHVMVNWSEISRLRATYRFPDQLNEMLFDRLTGSGLNLLKAFPSPHNGKKYVEVYELGSAGKP
ncbi:MAG: hypothetical protein HY287_14840 [Planctomycetes bacterium]|nr:hypothetical protein [Planctomycetota bacterium]MBI3835601.1 hypothetical protein [Planctomycetota bacterium]